MEDSAAAFARSGPPAVLPMGIRIAHMGTVPGTIG